jgi:hypothetical protein
MINFVCRVAALAEQASSCAFVQRALVSIVMQDHTMVNGDAATGLKLLQDFASLAHVFEASLSMQTHVRCKDLLAFSRSASPCVGIALHETPSTDEGLSFVGLTGECCQLLLPSYISL